CRRSLCAVLRRRPPTSTLFPYTTLFRSNPKVKASIEIGKKAHSDIQTKAAAKGWGVEVPMTDPQTGKQVRADLVTPGGSPVEIKPNTPSGKAKGVKQLPQYERATGNKGRVIYYDPEKYKKNN